MLKVDNPVIQRKFTHRRMFSQCKPNQPVAVGPVGKSFTTSPVGPCEMVSNCKLMDRIAYSPVGSTVIPDPVEQK